MDTPCPSSHGWSVEPCTGTQSGDTPLTTESRRDSLISRLSPKLAEKAAHNQDKCAQLPPGDVASRQPRPSHPYTVPRRVAPHHRQADRRNGVTCGDLYSTRMLLYGFLSSSSVKTKHRPVKLKNIQPICILMCILTIPEIAYAAKFDYKAAFSGSSVDIMTLSKSVPDLTKFTVCTYINLASSEPWTAFTYKLSTSSVNAYEIGVLGDSSSLKIWMFGTQINVFEKLNLYTWYELCITWDSKDEYMGFYLDGTLKEKQKLENITELVGGGNVVLGSSTFQELNSSVSVRLVGDIYMFRMWNTAQTSYFQKCIEGNVIKWNKDDWIYSPNVMQQDSSLHCAKDSSGDATPVTTGQLSPTNSPTTGSAQVGSTGTNALTSGSNTFTAVETTNITNITEFTINTSKSHTVWTSLNTNGSDTVFNSSTFSTSSVTTNINNGNSSWSSGITSQYTYLTSEYSQTTNGLMDCSLNDTNVYKNFQMDFCNSTCDSGTVYEIILKEPCTLPIDANKIKSFLNLTGLIIKNCSVFLLDIENVNNICNKLIPYKDYIQYFNKTDYCCCLEICPLSSCYISFPACSTNGSAGSGGSSTGGIQTTTADNSGALGTTVSNRTSTTVYRGPSTTFTKGSSTTFNILSNRTLDAELSTTIDIDSSTTLKGDITITTNSKSKSTINSKSTSVNSGTNATVNLGNTTTVNSESNATGDQGSMTTTHSENNNQTSTRPKTTGISGPTRTTNGESVESHFTANSGPTTTTTTHITTVYTAANTTKSPSTKDTLNRISSILNSGNLNSSIINSIVSQLENLLSGEVSTDDAPDWLNTMNSFLNISQGLLGPVSNRLIKIVDKIGLQLTFPGNSINVTSQSLALAVSKVNDSSFTGTSFSVNSSSGLQVSLGSQAPANSGASILLPASLINDMSPGDKMNASRVQFNYYANTSFFMDSSLKNQKLVSNVISSSVANLSVTNLSENITVALKTSAKNDSDKVDCVFWDFNKNNGTGGWSSYGCIVANTTQSETICKCNHLTSFAVLLNVSPNEQLSPENLLVLTFITYIGCGLSAIFLSVTLVTYIAFEKIRRDYPSKILIQLCAALVCLNLTFLLNPWIALYNDIPGLCISVAAFLHYFVLVSITWMGLEAFHMYLSLVKVFNTYVRKYMLKFCIIGWGAPAVVVAIILAVNKDLYFLKISGKYPNGSADYFCWVNDVVFWITIVGYFAIIFLLNVSMFVVVLIQLCRIKKQKQLGYQRKTTFQDLRSVAGITFLLGITWGFGFFSFGPGRTAMMYLFTIFNSLQGFFIFFFYCVAKENVRKQWRRYLCCGKFRLAENSDWSKTATNKLKKQTSKQGISSSSSNSIQSSSNTNSTTLLVSNDYSLHPNGNGNVLKERNGVSFMLPNGEMPLQEFPGRPSNTNGDVQQNSLRRTSNKGSVHFIDQI
ncbi:adhesion G-protein coupled receptor G2 isoform X2 [Phyllobates terribilis]|uniref:adhesion G-protein coupled receptor G2 isoform X2 n=1 Tax=Phyllobates terribilis TaxID=111132 RepID=UPI003CCB505F